MSRGDKKNKIKKVKKLLDKSNNIVYNEYITYRKR